MKKKLPIYLIIALLVISSYQFYNLHTIQKSIGEQQKHNLRDLNTRGSILYDDIQQLPSLEYDEILLLYGKAIALHTGYSMLPQLSLSLFKGEYYEIMHDLYRIAESVKQDVWSETEDARVKRVQLRIEFLINMSEKIIHELGDSGIMYYKELHKRNSKLSDCIRDQHNDFFQGTGLSGGTGGNNKKK